eukprot:12133016-Ditylum_brightwellii.AAC.1
MSLSKRLLGRIGVFTRKGIGVVSDGCSTNVSFKRLLVPLTLSKRLLRKKVALSRWLLILISTRLLGRRVVFTTKRIGVASNGYAWNAASKRLLVSISKWLVQNRGVLATKGIGVASDGCA